MLRTSTNIKSTNQSYSSLKAGLKYCLVILFAFAFSLQQFSAFAYTQLAESSTKENSTAVQAQRIFNNTQLSYHLPISSKLQYEMEVVEEENDNDRKNNNDDGGTYFLNSHSSTETYHTNFLKSRYLQLASSANRRSSVPLFILHHSWKCYLP